MRYCIHGERRARCSISPASVQPTSNHAELRLAALLPDMPQQMRATSAPAAGNLAHIAEVREQCIAPLDIEHREWMICLGRGFDFLHTPNLALIIGPYSPDLADPVAQGGRHHRQPTWPPGASRMTAFCCWLRSPTTRSASTALAPN
jgi:hypothetical protein